MSDRQALLGTARRYLQRNPREVARIVRSAFGLRLGVPLDALRFFAEQAMKSGKAEDIVIVAVPPGFRVSAKLDLMRTPVRANAVLYIERMRVSGDEMRIELRLEDVRLRVDGESSTPVAMLINSGALDLSKPGNLVKQIPKLPAFVVDARDNRITLDLLRHPKLASNPTARNAISLLTSWVTLHGVETDEDHMDVAFRALPSGVRQAARSVRQHLLAPTVKRALALIPGRGAS